MLHVLIVCLRKDSKGLIVSAILINLERFSTVLKELKICTSRYLAALIEGTVQLKILQYAMTYFAENETNSSRFVFFSQVCKKRSKAFNTLKSPKEAGVKMNSGKMFKHVKLMHLSTLKRVIDINETDGKSLYLRH